MITTPKREHSVKGGLLEKSSGHQAVRCRVCSARSVIAYTNLRDVLFGSTGTWDMRRCADRTCGLHWIEPSLTADQLNRAYANYYTHAPEPKAGSPAESLPLRMYRGARAGYLAHRFGYPLPEASKSSHLLWPLLFFTPLRRHRIGRGVMFLEKKSWGGNVLDLGCGSGEWLDKMTRLGWRTQGVEPDPAAAEIARRGGHEVFCGTFEEAALPGGSFDAIVMSHVIEHLANPAATLRECARVLGLGGAWF